VDLREKDLRPVKDIADRGELKENKAGESQEQAKTGLLGQWSVKVRR